jgi:hypothetical protein
LPPWTVQGLEKSAAGDFFPMNYFTWTGKS